MKKGKILKFKEDYDNYWMRTPPYTVNNPDIINQFPYSIRSALRFWVFYRKAYESATDDQDSSVVNVTKLINGGDTGIDDRRRGFILSKEVFK